MRLTSLSSLLLFCLALSVACDPANPKNDTGLDVTDIDGDGSPVEEDCDDNDASSFPGAVEVCDGVDNDCDGDIDNGLSMAWYIDADDDGWGIEAGALYGCAQPDGTAEVSGDCNDADAAIHPEAVEICDDVDNDCDDLTDNDDDSLSDATVWYLDNDSDGFGGPSTTSSCEQPASYVADGTDCDDSNSDIHPDADEICDGVDNDCDELIDSIDDSITGASIWYLDSDGDSYGDETHAMSSCDAPARFVSNSDDCDDSNPDIQPEAVEVCDTIDNDCDDAVDEDAVDASIWYPDADLDGYGDESAPTPACGRPDSYLDEAGDCDDSDGEVNPEGIEVCDGADNDCDGVVDPDCSTCGDLTVITYYDSFSTSTEPANLAALAIGATSLATSSSTTFATSYDSGTWDVLIVDVPGSGVPSEVTTRISTHIAAGGIVLFSYWDLDAYPTIATSVGVSVDSSFDTPRPLHPQPTTDLWDLYEDLPVPIADYSSDAGDNGDVISALDTSTSEELAYYSADPTLGAIIATFEGRVIVNGFLPWDFQATDDDADGTSDMVELFTNEILWTTGCRP